MPIASTNDSPRIINSAFTVQENNKYERIIINLLQLIIILGRKLLILQLVGNTISADSGFLTIDLDYIEDAGQLMGGNYIFMIKYCDEDYNETLLVSQV